MSMESFFTSSFSGKSFIEKSKARVFFYYSLFMYAALAMLILLYSTMPIPPHIARKGFIGAVLIILLVTLSLFALRKGRLTLAVWVYALPTILAVSALRLLNSPGAPETAFSTYIFYMPYLIVFVAVFGNRWQTVCTTAFFFLTNWATWFLVRGVPGEIGTGIHTGIVNSSLGLLTTGIVSVALINIVDKYISQMRSEADESQRKLERIRAAMEIAHDGVHVGHTLVSESGAMQTAAELIEREIAGIRDEMLSLRSDAERTADANAGVVASTETLSRATQGYHAITEQASSAVVEMTASIENISAVSSKSGTGIELLSKSVAAGIETAETSAHTIASLTESSEALQEVVAVIGAISSQTNLLAMNAAIEAAHAGESGKGFAVVAEEIRRLAEETATNSKTIEDGLRTFFGKINLAEESNRHIGEAFREIGDAISATRSAFDEISSGMKELAYGTGEINSSVSDVVASSRDMSDSIKKMNSMIADNAGAVGSLREKSASALSRLDSITASFRDILSRAENVRSLGKKSDEVIHDLDESIKAI